MYLLMTLEHKVENAHELNENNPELDLDGKLEQIYDLILEFENVQEKLENGQYDDWEGRMGLIKRNRRLDAQICALEYEIRCRVHQNQPQSNEFVSGTQVEA